MTHDEKIQHVENQIDAIEHSRRDHPCIHGHFDCAVRDGGRCSDEQVSELEATLERLKESRPATPLDNKTEKLINVARHIRQIETIIAGVNGLMSGQPSAVDRHLRACVSAMDAELNDLRLGFDALQRGEQP